MAKAIKSANTDKRIDDYIAKAAPFARPILNHLRVRVHAACPDVVEEIKWGSPHFSYKGMFCGMAAFKEHCTFGFWKHELLLSADEAKDDAMGQFGRIKSLADLPPDKRLDALIRKARELNDAGVKINRVKKPTKGPPVVPPDLAAALKSNKKARDTFQAFSPSHQREYIEWLDEAKREETRKKRLATTIEWLSEGKPRNWKYMNC